MAGVTGHKSLTDGLFQHILAQEKAMKADVQEAALEAAIAGEDKVRHIIDTTESSLSPGKEHRNWTYSMRQNVGSDMKTKGHTTTIRAGWMENHQKGYFLIQEHGGYMPDGRYVSPMEALEAGHIEMLKTLTRWGLKIQ